MIYQLYTTGLPHGKVAAHFHVQFDSYKYSESIICANEAIAKQDMELMMCKWMKSVILAYSNSREKAYKLSNFNHSEVNKHVDVLNAITHLHKPEKIYMAIVLAKTDLEYFLPGKDSPLRNWRILIDTILKQCGHQMCQFAQF